MTLHEIAFTGLVLYWTYAIAFTASGYKTQGGPAMKSLALVSEITFTTALVWAAWFS